MKVILTKELYLMLIHATWLKLLIKQVLQISFHNALEKKSNRSKYEGSFDQRTVPYVNTFNR